MKIPSPDLDLNSDLVRHIILGVYLVFFLFTHAKQFQHLATAMADALVPQTPQKKLFKAATKTLTPTRTRKLSSAHSVDSDSAQRAASHRAPRSVASDTSEHLREQAFDNIARSTKLAPLTSVADIADGRAGGADSETTTETPTGLIDNYVLTPAETASRSTGPRSSTSTGALQNAKGPSPNSKDILSSAESSTKEFINSVVKNVVDKPTDSKESATNSSTPETSDTTTDKLHSPDDIAKYLRDQGNPEMADFVAALAAQQSSDASQEAHSATESLTKETQSAVDGHDEKIASRAEKDTPTRDDRPRIFSRPTSPDIPEPAQVSKTMDGTPRDSEANESTIQPTNKMGEPDVSKISETANPHITNGTSGSQKPRSTGSESGKQNGEAHVVDNMGQPARLERRIEIPLQRPSKVVNSPLSPEKQRDNNLGLGDIRDLPSVENLPSTDDLPDISDADSQDPPEEILDPIVHSTSSNITPIPKIPKIAPIGALPPFGLSRLAKGLAGYVIDDVGNIVDESGDKVLGHASGDLPAMIGKAVSENGEVHGDDGEVIGYVSENFVNPPSPTEIPGELLGRLRVDHRGNILDSDGKVIGKFNQPLPENNKQGKQSGSQSAPRADSKEQNEQKPKVNANTGGSPSDLFLDVKSTTDGIQLTIRIPTTFSRPPAES